MEEADETLFWLELIIDSEIYNVDLTVPLIKECTEILKIVSKSRKTLKDKIDNTIKLNLDLKN